jgi:hypothetical protein
MAGAAWADSASASSAIGSYPWASSQAEATVQLVRQLGGEIAGLGFAVELDFLKGRAKFPEYDVFSLLHYDE